MKKGTNKAEISREGIAPDIIVRAVENISHTKITTRGT